MPDRATDYVYWVLLIVFGLFGVWHAIAPARQGHEWRNAWAALVLYVMLGIIGLRYFLMVAALLVVTANAPLAATMVPTGPSGHRHECHHNAKGELVCRTCWHAQGRVRCGKPRIVR